MNKIKFQLLSSALFDETAIVDISLNDNVLATDAIIATSGTTLVYNVDNFQDLNRVKLFLKNGMSFADEFIKETFSDQGEITDVKKSNIDLTVDQIDDIVLFVYSVSISQDNGTTWEDITIGKELNPQFVVFKNYTSNNLTSYIRSTDHSTNQLCSMAETYFETNEALAINGEEFSFYFSKDTSQKYLNNFLIDPTVYQVLKVKGFQPGKYVCLVSEENRSSFDSIIDQEQMYTPPLYRP